MVTVDITIRNKKKEAKRYETYLKKLWSIYDHTARSYK